MYTFPQQRTLRSLDVYKRQVEGHPQGDYYTVGMPIKLSMGNVDKILPAPMLGEHTEEILKEVCGFSAEKIAELKACLLYTSFA